MIIDIEPGSKVSVPTEADFLIRVANSFSSGELVGVTPVLEAKRYDGSEIQIAGTVVSTSFLFAVVPGAFDPGEWTINPVATVSAKVRRWPRPAILVFENPLIAGVDCGC